MRTLIRPAIRLLALLLALFAAAAAAQELVAVPPLKGRVTDLTGTLTAQQVATLDERLAAFEASKGSQIAVLMVPTTKPESIEQYSIRVAEAWKVGRKQVDDGVIVVVAKNDHRVRIEVGYGLEGPIPDLYAKRIIREAIGPHFVEGDFYAGLVAGTDRLMRLIEGERLPPPPPQRPKGELEQVGDDYASIFVVLLVMVVVVGGILRAVLGRVLGSMATGGAAGFLAMVLVGSLLAAVAVGVIAFFVTLALGGAGALASARRGGRASGGWGGGAWGGGSWGGGGRWGGGGGWSGGGGGFGGGGASGSWD